ncbi:hypothetical protein HPP92_022203 [Vanilla planifolia]|uniref:Trichome birefringence-like C-terminal domain-containing protein n=1 Tax=Vanilla planifolia TaxID=51239 RepID=A0A835PUW8_VANPL|nr:hypothetical protein HPP92_022203 [Vanilla planifolia]
MDVKEAFRKMTETLTEWAEQNLRPQKGKPFSVRNIPSLKHSRRVVNICSPRSNGTWDTGGSCGNETAPKEDGQKVRPEPWSNRVTRQVLREKEKVGFLNITYLTELRGDGHPSSHRERGTPPDAPQDCSHWCLPGVPDTWNETTHGMPRGHGKASFTSEKISDASFALSRRSPEQTSCKFHLKENRVFGPILRSNDQRHVVIAFHTPDIHVWRSMALFASFKQRFELRDKQGSVDKVKADVANNINTSHSLPAIFFPFYLSKEQSTTSVEFPALSSSSAKTITNCRSYPHRLKQKGFCKSRPNNSLATTTPMESVTPVDVIDLDILADATAQLENPSKPSARKKGKKKRRQNKRSIRNMESQDEVNSDASVFGASVTGVTACSVAVDNSLSTIGACQSLLVQDSSDVAMEKLDIDNAKEVCLSRSSRSVSESLDENISDSTQQVSLPNKFDEASLDQVSIEAVSSCSNPSSEMPLITSHPHTLEIGNAQGSLDCCEVQCSMANGGSNPLSDGKILTSKNVFIQGDLPRNQEKSMSSSCSVNSSYWAGNSVETECSNERDLSSSQASTSDDFHPVIRTKRGRISRTYSGSSDGMNTFSKLSLRGGSDRENKHSQWQKMPKHITAELPYRRNDKKLAMQHVDLLEKSVQTFVGPKKVSAVKENGIGKSYGCSYPTKRDVIPSDSSPAAPVSTTNSCQLSSSDADCRSTYVFSENLKRKTNSTTEQQRYLSLNACHTRKSIVDRPSKFHIPQKEGLETTTLCTGISQQTKIIDSSISTDQNSRSAEFQLETMSENICSILHDTSLVPQEVLVNSSMTGTDSVHSKATEQCHGNTQTSKDISNNIQINKEDERCHSLGDESAHLQIGSNDSNSGHQSPKWIPIGRNDLIADKGQIKNLTDFVPDTVLNSPRSSVSDEILSSVSRDYFSLSRDGIQVLSPSSRNMDCSSPEEVKLTSQLDCQLCTSSETSSGPSHPSSCPLCQKVKEQLFQGFETDLLKIVDAVTGSYKLVIASEEFHLAIGSRLAQIERILSCASPVLETGCITSFTACSQNQVILNSTCTHQVPTISLQKLWQWYEKPGSYGLEVKLEELHASRRSPNALSEFSAYFAPYLSAVQLFGRSQKTLNRNLKVAEGEMMRTGKAYKPSEALPCVDSLSTSSELSPKDCKGADTWLQEFSSTKKLEHFNNLTHSEHLDDAALLFEYFDSDQPQQRRPLFNKIKELVQGGSPSNCNFFGDPTTLESLNFEELHPASWYAVAWYPIYRIPDGTFRSAFLTYHSFGQLLCRTASDSITGSVNSLISPVVGLQTYNAKGEWFKSIASQTDASSFSQCPSEVLRDRLLSLERTAHVMSRACVLKGEQQCTNRHQDYEFFLSRKCFPLADHRGTCSAFDVVCSQR